MSAETKPFENENLTVSLKREPGSIIVLDIHVQPKATEAAWHKAIKSVNKEVSLPGFRKGKAPEAMILKSFSGHVENEWRELVVRTAFSDAIELTKVYPYRQESIRSPKLNSISHQDGASITVEYEALPEVPSVDITSLTISPIEKQPVTDEQTQEALDNIRYQHAEWNEFTDRAAKKGDFVTLDIHSIETEELQPLFEDVRFQVDEEHMGKWMRDLVIGMKINEFADGESKQEKKKSDPTYDKDFKPTKCRITLKKIQTATLPELDDTFAQKLKLDNIDDLKSKVTEQLDKMAEEQQQRALREQLSNQLVATYLFDLPKSLVEPDMKRSSEAAMRRIRAKQKKGEDLSAEAEKAAAEAAHKVEESYRLFFLLRKVANDHEIQVGQDEVMHELVRQLYAAPEDEKIIDPQSDPQEARSRIYAYLVERKAKDWLLEQALEKKA